MPSIHVAVVGAYEDAVVAKELAQIAYYIVEKIHISTIPRAAFEYMGKVYPKEELWFVCIGY